MKHVRVHTLGSTVIPPTVSGVKTCLRSAVSVRGDVLSSSGANESAVNVCISDNSSRSGVVRGPCSQSHDNGLTQ